VTAPSLDAMRSLLDRPGGDVVAPLLAVLAVRDLGPAMFLDAARFAARRQVDEDCASRIRYQAFRAYLLPQLDGCDDEDARLLFEALAGAFDVAELNELRRAVRSISGSATGHATTSERDRRPLLATAG
ncbi:MAG: hypothetical protein ACRDZU_15220, partial [Acidimicrobiales bacterium]